MTVVRPLIVLAVGGSGGHVFPAAALAGELTARGYSLAMLTDGRGALWNSPALDALEMLILDVRSLSGRTVRGKLAAAIGLVKGTAQARRFIADKRPSVVIGFGGYASVPGLVAAVVSGVPIALHEQNATLGRVNRLFARRAAVVATVYATITGAKGMRIAHTGMPMRDSIVALMDRPYHAPVADSPINVLALGGSQGARILSDILPAALKAIPAGLRERVRVVQQARPEDVERSQGAYQQAGIEAVVQAFFDDMPQRLSKAHVLIARAGASTIAEAALAGLPSLLIPYPYAADNHQQANAQSFASAGGGWVLPQADLSPEILAAQLIALLPSPARLQMASAAARQCAIPDGAARLADVVEGIVLRKETSLSWRTSH